MTLVEFALAYVGVTVVLTAVRRACGLAVDWAGGKVDVQETVPVLPEGMASGRTSIGGMAPCSYCYGSCFPALTVTHEREIYLWRKCSVGAWNPFCDLVVYRDHEGEYHLFLREGTRVDKLDEGVGPVAGTHAVPKTVSIVPKAKFFLLLPWRMKKKARQEALAGEVMRS